jgi:alkanesulfonate monooxygenase SsuD/methylene tetrahydromethanopterin reductase-like flavin-dependent oxidoreductase (luciferase family)
MRTARVRIGTTVTPLPRRRPWKLARETVSIDRLSGGRLILGVGIGGGEAEWDHLGEETDLRTRGAMLDEALDVLVGLWQGEPFSYDGQFYHVKDATFTPRPVQRPRIPIWVGGFWPHKAPFRRAARWDGMFPLFQFDSDEAELDQFKAAMAYVEARRESDAPFDVIAMGVTPGEGDDQAQQVRAYQTAGATWWLELIAPFRFDRGLDEEPWPLAAMRERVCQGPPVTSQ